MGILVNSKIYNMKNRAFKVPVIESERGWGSKIDDYMVCISNDVAKNFIEIFNSSNNKEVTANWYMYADTNITEFSLSDLEIMILNNEDDGKMWLKELNRKVSLMKETNNKIKNKEKIRYFVENTIFDNSSKEKIIHDITWLVNNLNKNND